ncbi:flagellar biosynthetic protein FliO [Fredinandcohnia humi]
MKHIKIIAFGFLFLHVLLVTFPVQAEEGHVNKSVYENIVNSDGEQEANTDKSESTTETQMGSNELTAVDFFKMIFTTLFVIALIYVLLKFVNKRNRFFNQYKFIENLGGTSLGTNRSIQIIKVGDRILVVGVGESIQLLKEIDDTDEINEILEQHNSKLETMIQPRDIITKLLEKRNKTKSSQQDVFSTILQKQLSEIKQGRKKIVEQLEDKESSKE